VPSRRWRLISLSPSLLSLLLYECLRFMMDYDEAAQEAPGTFSFSCSLSGYRIVPLIRDTFFENCAQDVPYMGCKPTEIDRVLGRLRTLIARYPIRNPPVILHVLLMASVVDRR